MQIEGLRQGFATRRWPASARHGCAALIVGLVAALKVWLWTLSGYPLLLFFLAVVISAALFGRGSGLVATGLSALISDYVFIPPFGSLAVINSEDALALIAFTSIGMAASLTIGALYDGVDKLAIINRELATANERLTASDQEKDTLLQEAAHRTRNDLAMLAAMVRLERARLEDQKAAAALTAIATRIHVLSRLQDRLTRASGEVSVSSKAFITDLCDDLKATFVGFRPLRVDVKVEDHRLPQDRAVPVGLIINELATNAFKYAFPEDRAGLVCVRFSRQGAAYCLSVEDDGVGSETTREPIGTGLGQRLVRSMAAQLGGAIDIRPNPHRGDPGTLATVRFPVEERDHRPSV